jgi:hypothetical protein
LARQPSESGHSKPSLLGAGLKINTLVVLTKEKNKKLRLDIKAFKF